MPVYFTGLVARPIVDFDYPNCPKTKFVTLSFSDGTLLEIDREKLKILDYFQELNDLDAQATIEISHCTSWEFESLIKLVIDECDPKKIISSIDDIYFLEKLQKTLADFVPNRASEIYQSFVLELEAMPPSAAEKIYLKYKEVNEKNRDQRKTSLVKIAENVLYQSLFFETPEEAEHFANELMELQKERLKTERELFQNHSLSNPSSKDPLEMLKLAENKRLNQYLNTINYLILKKESFKNLRTQKMAKMEHIIKLHENGTLPFIEDLARQARDNIKQYRSMVNAILSHWNIESREDLMEHFDGRKNYLFEYYGFTIPLFGDYSTVIKHSSGHGYIFLFKNHTPYTMESEIRQFLKERKLALPPRLIREI